MFMWYVQRTEELQKEIEALPASATEKLKEYATSLLKIRDQVLKNIKELLENTTEAQKWFEIVPPVLVSTLPGNSLQKEYFTYYD